jgi:enhancer of polycomb-like protein
LKQKVKQDIPIPTITLEDTYYTEVTPTFNVPDVYVHHRKKTIEEIDQVIDYIADEEDELWLKSYPDFDLLHKALESRNGDGAIEYDETKNSTTTLGNPSKQRKKSSSKISRKDSQLKSQLSDLFSSTDDTVSTNYRHEDHRELAPVHIFEHIMDILEKATAFESVVTLVQGEKLILEKIPKLGKFFDSLGSPHIQGDQKAKIAITVIYDYWIQKRSKLRKPLLRKFWPCTASHDTNPHLVFRPREKGKYKLRKKRQNDMDTLRKMKQLRSDFDKVRVLLELIRSREQLNSTMFDLRTEWFDQRLYDMTDSSGLPRHSDRLSFKKIDDLLSIPMMVDIYKLDKGRKNKRKKGAVGFDIFSQPSLLQTSHTDGNTEVNSNDPFQSPALQRNIASLENPISFLDPLSTRDIYAVSWENSIPCITSYVDSHPLPTYCFRHRPRVGRGGRVIIDRLPVIFDFDKEPIQVFRAGDELNAARPTNQLLDLLPKPLDYSLLSRRIEEISATMLMKEEMHQVRSAPSKVNTSTNAEDIGKASLREILVRRDDWITTDSNSHGEEQYVIGPV